MPLASLLFGSLLGMAIAVCAGMSSGSILIGVLVYGVAGAVAVLGIAVLASIGCHSELDRGRRTGVIPAE